MENRVTSDATSKQQTTKHHNEQKTHPDDGTNADADAATPHSWNSRVFPPPYPPSPPPHLPRKKNRTMTHPHDDDGAAAGTTMRGAMMNVVLGR